MKSFLKIHLIVTLTGSLLALGVIDRIQWLSFALCQFLVWLSLLSIWLSVWLFFLKKNIALLVSVIVLKWPVLIYLTYKLTEGFELSAVFFSLGVVPVLTSALVWSVIQQKGI